MKQMLECGNLDLPRKLVLWVSLYWNIIKLGYLYWLVVQRWRKNNISRTWWSELGIVALSLFVKLLPMLLFYAEYRVDVNFEIHHSIRFHYINLSKYGGVKHKVIRSLRFRFLAPNDMNVVDVFVIWFLCHLHVGASPNESGVELQWDVEGEIWRLSADKENSETQTCAC